MAKGGVTDKHLYVGFWSWPGGVWPRQGTSEPLDRFGGSWVSPDATADRFLAALGTYAVPAWTFSALATFTPGFTALPAIAAAIQSAVSWLAVAMMPSLPKWT